MGKVFTTIEQEIQGQQIGQASLATLPTWGSYKGTQAHKALMESFLHQDNGVEAHSLGAPFKRLLSR